MGPAAHHGHRSLAFSEREVPLPVIGSGDGSVAGPFGRAARRLRGKGEVGRDAPAAAAVLRHLAAAAQVCQMYRQASTNPA